MIGEYIFGDAEHMLESGSCKFHRNVGGKILLSRIFGLPREKELGNMYVLSLNHYFSLPMRFRNFNIECKVRSAVQLWNSYLNHTSALQTTTRSDYFDTEPPEYIRRISKSQKLMSSRIPMRSTDCTVSYGDSYRLGSVVKGLNAVRLIAVAVLFDAEFTDFVIDNIHYIDRELRNLQHKLFEAFCCDKKEFHWNTAIVCSFFSFFIPKIIFQACFNFRGNMISFHNAFRMINYLRESPTMNFFVNLNNLITIFETKESGYFLSKLISSVLMFHLSWVTTTNEAYNNRLGNFWSRSEIIDNKTKPLLTILGCIGLLSHTTRIVITGKNLEHVGNILGILLYFVRFHRLNISKKQIKNIHFSPNDLWAFTKAEILARMEQRKNLTNNDDSKKLAEKWQLGEFSAIFSQKFLLRENLTNDPWIVKFNNSLFNLPSMRFRAKSEPQRITNDEDSLSDDNDFRPRSVSNPISQFPTQPLSKDFEKYCAKDAYPDHNHFTKASGKVPYGFTIPKFADDKIHDNEIDYLQSLFQKYEYNEANHVWGKIKQHNSKRLKLKLMDFHCEDLILTIPLQEERKMFISKSEKIYETQPCSSKDSNSVNTNQMDEPCSSSSFITKRRDFETSNTFDTPELHGNNDIPYWKKNRKSSTALARALTNNSAHLLDSLNPDELEEIFENRLNDIHFTENTIDEYVDNFSNDESYSTITDSLYGGINNKFEPAFVIQGIDGNLINMKTLKEIIKKEISQPESFYITIPKNDEKESSKDTNKLKSKNHSDTKEFEFIQMTSVYILADVDNGKISVSFLNIIYCII